MIALGMAGTLVGYTLSLWGYCLVKGYDITFGQLVNPAHVFTWPKKPPMIPNTQVTPGGTQNPPSTTAASTTSTGPMTGTPSGGTGTPTNNPGVSAV